MQCPNCRGYRHEGACPPRFDEPHSAAEMSSSYDYDPRHYRFTRRHTGAAPEPLPPLQGYGVELQPGWSGLPPWSQPCGLW